MEKILKCIFVGGLTLSAFIIGNAYGVYKTNKEYQDTLQPYIKNILKITKEK